jgi:hypothetical protein
LYAQVSGNSGSELTNIDGKECNNIPEAVNKLALSARLGHSCEIGIILKVLKKSAFIGFTY